MKKTRSILLLTVLLLMLMTTAAFAEASDYTTIKWGCIELQGMFEPINIEVTLTGMVGKQVNEYASYTPDISVLYYPEAWGVCYDKESDSYTMFVGEEEKSFTLDELKKYLSENYKSASLNVLAMVDDGTMTTKLTQGTLYNSFPGYYTILDGKETGETLIAVPGLGQAYSTNISEVGGTNEETFDDLPEGEDSLDYMYEFMNINNEDVAIWIVSEKKASELLVQLEEEMKEDEEVNPLDTADEWAKSELTAAIEAGISTERMTNSNYKDNATREEFCEIVMKMYDGLGGQEVVVEENPFTDTTDAETLRANKAGIVNGSDGKFNPNDKLTRQELCAMIIRALGNAGVELDNTKEFQKEYADIDKIDDWAVDSIKILNGYDIYKGDGTNLIPTDTVDKQTAVVLLYRTFQMFK